MAHALSDILPLALSVRWSAHKDQDKTHTRAAQVIELLGFHRPLTRPITPSDLRRAASHLNPVSAATKNRYIASFLSALRCAREEGWFTWELPVWRPLREKGKVRYSPSRLEVAGILRDLWTRNKESARLARFLYRTGMRVSEAQGSFRWSPVPLPGTLPGLIVQDTKNGDDRFVPVPPAVGPTGWPSGLAPGL